MRRVCVLLMLGWAATGWAQPAGYYSAATGKAGGALRQALHDIVKRQTIIPYSSSTNFDTGDALRTLDQDPANGANVWLLYAQRSEPKDTFGLSSGWNREHLWCDSYGLDGVEPAYSDLHNLRAEDANVNSIRGNKFYDTSSTSPADGYKNPAHAEAPLCSSDANSWEPPPAVKGDIARALFYMAVRYTGDAANEPALRLTDRQEAILATASAMGRLTVLLKWAAADPVDTRERLRNDRVYGYQANRNPFVDRPEWVNAAFAPELSVRAAGTALWVEWPGDYTLVTLERAPSAAGPWEPAGAAVVATNGMNRATIAAPGSAVFFRLRY